MHLTQSHLVRTFFCVTIAAASTLVVAAQHPTHAADAAYRFMRTVTNKLQAAQRKPGFADRATGFTHVVKNYAHLGRIGHKALGDYKHKLKKKLRNQYYTGMASWIGYYAAGEAPKFPIKRVLLSPNAIREGSYHIVNSQIQLVSGKNYNVRWVLTPSNRSFKVVEVQLDIGLGLANITPYLRDIFVRHIEENNESVTNLVTALAKFNR